LHCVQGGQVFELLPRDVAILLVSVIRRKRGAELVVEIERPPAVELGFIKLELLRPDGAQVLERCGSVMQVFGL
jgi:hypothetical protein